MYIEITRAKKRGVDSESLRNIIFNCKLFSFVTRRKIFHVSELKRKNFRLICNARSFMPFSFVSRYLLPCTKIYNNSL